MRPTAHFDCRLVFVAATRWWLGAALRLQQARHTGRAGRTGPGLNLRLWSPLEERGQREGIEPEVARVDLSGARVKDVRLVISAVAPVPMRREEAEAVLRGKPFSEELARKAGEAAVADATPLRDNKYKIRMLKATVAHTLIEAARRAKGGK